MVAVAKSHIEEKNLQDNVHCAVADAKDAVAIESLGQFDISLFHAIGRRMETRESLIRLQGQKLQGV
jgi:hypothetical protein